MPKNPFRDHRRYKFGGRQHYVETHKPPPLLLQAITERRLVTFIYDELNREVEPHACGVLSNGRTVLVGYQAFGLSWSENEPPWRMFKISEMVHLQLTDRTFEQPRPGYNPHDRRLQTVYAQV